MKNHPNLTTIWDRSSEHYKESIHTLCYLEPDDSGSDFCRPCAQARASARADGVRVCEMDESACHDSPPVCYDCGKHLAGHLTDYGAREELHVMEALGFDADDPRACWVWCLCEMAFPEGSDEYKSLLELAGVRA
jgi:hypothetical protein